MLVLGSVINVFEAVDVIALIKGGVYDDLNLSVGDALLKRQDVRPLFFPFLLFPLLLLLLHHLSFLSPLLSPSPLPPHHPYNTPPLTSPS